ncbi:hypothetical protein [Dongshaea marina]|nr:hypothetical protein [Dongshaea marina]
MTRELLYTGITRSKQRLHLYANVQLLSRAIRRQTERFSGLSQRLTLGS